MSKIAPSNFGVCMHCPTAAAIAQGEATGGTKALVLALVVSLDRLFQAPHHAAVKCHGQQHNLQEGQPSRVTCSQSESAMTGVAAMNQIGLCLQIHLCSKR